MRTKPDRHSTDGRSAIRTLTAGDKRSQTTVDFAVGMSIFLFATAVVTAFTPTMFESLQGTQQDPIVADRLALEVTNQMIGGDHPGTFNATCTGYFFNESSPTNSDPCPVFDYDQPPTEKLGIKSDQFVNVSLQANVTTDAGLELLCGDGSGDVAWGGSTSPPCTGSGEVLAVGRPPSTAVGSVTHAKRVGLLENRSVYVVVRVWG